MSYEQVLRDIFNSVRPVKSMRIRFVKEVIDQILVPDDQGDGKELELSDFKSHMPTDVNVNSLFPGLKLKAPTEAEKEVLFPMFECDVTLCEKGWMFLETWKHGIHKKDKDKRALYKRFHADGVFRSFPIIVRLPRYGPYELFGMPSLRLFWTDFEGGIPYWIDYSRRYSEPSRHYFNGIGSFSTNKKMYLFDENSGFKVGRKKFTFSDGRIIEKISYHKQFSNGVWFQVGHDLVRYPDPKTGLEGRYRQCIRVTDVEFDIDFDPKKPVNPPEGIDAVSMASWPAR